MIVEFETATTVVPDGIPVPLTFIPTVIPVASNTVIVLVKPVVSPVVVWIFCTTDCTTLPLPAFSVRLPVVLSWPSIAIPPLAFCNVRLAPDTFQPSPVTAIKPVPSALPTTTFLKPLLFTTPFEPVSSLILERALELRLKPPAAPSPMVMVSEVLSGLRLSVPVPWMNAFISIAMLLAPLPPAINEILPACGADEGEHPSLQAILSPPISVPLSKYNPSAVTAPVPLSVIAPAPLSSVV